MATVEEIVKDIQSLAPIGISMPACAKWLDNRYKELVARVRFRNLRKVGELSVPGVIDTGTVSATRGSTTITGVSTTFQTEVGSGAQEHYYFRARTAWYKIASVGGELALTLSSAFAEDDVSGVSYEIVKRTHPLASDARWLGMFVHSRIRRKIDAYSRDEFDIAFPGRPIAGRWPEAVCEDGIDSNGYIQVELYPPPDESELIRYVYWSLPTSLTISSTIPAKIDAYVLKEGTLVDVYRTAKIMQIEKGNVEAAAVYANEEAKQRRIWEDKILDAIRTQRGVDDLTFIIESFGGRRSASEVRTAREHILAGWSH